jgi:solute carrier family 35 protein F5
MPANSLSGDIICLFAAVFYGMYTTAIHQHLPSVDKTSLFFGYLGTIGFLCCTPVVLILNATKIEDLSLVSLRALVLIAAKGLFDNVLSDGLWAVAMKWTSPTVATLGLALTIPFAIFGAVLLGDGLPTPLGAFGALVMLVGFVCVNVPGGSGEEDDVYSREEVDVTFNGGGTTL